MCKLGMNLTSGPEGLSVQTQTEVPIQGVQKGIGEPLYVYEWAIRPTHGRLADEMIKQAQEQSKCFGSELEWMQPDQLHTTTHVNEGRDRLFEKDFFKQSSLETIRTEYIYVGKKYAAASVQLTTEQKQLFSVCNSVPHISLGKAQCEQYEEIGPWLRLTLRFSDWEPTLVDEWQYSKRANVYRLRAPTTFLVQRILTLAEDPSITMPAISSPLPPPLQGIPEALWAKGKNDVGLIKNCAPITITPKGNYRPRQKQYPLRKEALEGIRPVMEALKEAGVIIPCPSSPVRTPIFPVKKAGGGWRFVQDLQAVNSVVHARAPTVPNPHTILSGVPQNTKYYTVVDLANAFFSVPVHPDSQYWFAFEFDEQLFTFTRLCQGYCESPTIYNQALKQSLESLTMPEGVTLLSFVDNLLIAAPTKEACTEATIKLLKHLAQEGHKASLEKLQFCKEEVTFLGHILKGATHTLSTDRAEAIAKIPKPQTKKQMLSFLGTASYCRAFIPSYANIEAPLRGLIPTKGHNNSTLEWTEQAEETFVN
uniref:ribonuclease H n=1 Tax=Astyanax mexicanus TaxID=7994 RepID=A0A3B1K1C7_ASTMX